MHRYIKEIDCSSGQFKSAKLKDKVYTKKAPSLLNNIKKRDVWPEFLTLALVGG